MRFSPLSVATVALVAVGASAIYVLKERWSEIALMKV